MFTSLIPYLLTYLLTPPQLLLIIIIFLLFFFHRCRGIVVVVVVIVAAAVDDDIWLPLLCLFSLLVVVMSVSGVCSLCWWLSCQLAVSVLSAGGCHVS